LTGNTFPELQINWHCFSCRSRSYTTKMPLDHCSVLTS